MTKSKKPPTVVSKVKELLPPLKQAISNSTKRECDICLLEKPIQDFFPSGRYRGSKGSLEAPPTCRECVNRRIDIWGGKMQKLYGGKGVRKGKSESVSQWEINYKEARDDRRRELLEFLGNRCERCGFDDERALQIDHIMGGGRRKKENTGTQAYYKEILNDPDVKIKYQLLCANCNWIKRFERGETR